MQGNCGSVETGIKNYMGRSGMMLANNCLFAVMLVCPMFHGLSKYFANTYLCAGIILLIAFMNYSLYKAAFRLTPAASGFSADEICWKTKTRILAWAALVPAVMLIGIGPIASSSAYAVDKFTRTFGLGVINDYSVSKKVHYFLFALIIYGLLVFNFYLNIIISLGNNLNNKIRRLGRFADTLLFVGWSFLLVCVYRQFSSQYRDDLTLYMLKSFMVFMIPAFYLWETGKLRVQDVRVMLSLALFSLVLSVNAVFCFGSGRFGGFIEVLAAVLFASMLFFAANKAVCILRDKVLYSRIVVISLICSLSLAAYSLVFEFLNILALKTDSFIDAGKVLRIAFYFTSALAVGLSFCFKKQASSRTAGRALFVFVLGIALVTSQPLLINGGWLDIFEGANYALPVSDFFNFGKIPLVENFPAHHLSQIASSVAYGFITSDYRGALFSPWPGWLCTALIILVLYCFVKAISNGLVALSLAVLLPYVIKLASYYDIGLVAFLPFAWYVRTLRTRYLVQTVVLSICLVAYRLDIGFSFLVAIVFSSLCVRVFYGRKGIFFRTVQYFAAGGAAVFALFIVICLIKDINPLFRIQQYLSVASSDNHWGYNSSGDTEKNLYSFFYYVIPVFSVLCFITAAVCRKKFTAAQFAVLLCLLFAYYANLPRLLVRHSLAEYVDFLLSLWFWTMLLALPLLLSTLFSSRSSFILFQTPLVLIAFALFNNTTFYDNSSLQNMVNRADLLAVQNSPDARKHDAGLVFSRGSRVAYDENGSESIIYANEIKNIADFLLSPDETFLDFTNQSMAYAWSGREDPAYVVQLPSMLSGEKSQVLFIKDLEAKLKNIPIAIMPTDKGWYSVMSIDGINNNIRHYLVAEWIYNNYRPLIKFNDYSSVWVLKSRYDECHNKLKGAEDGSGAIQITAGATPKHQIHFIDWGYDNFVSLPQGAVPSAEFITPAHDYNVELLPFVWGQLDSRNAASNADLASVSMNGGVYTWGYSGRETRSAYLRLDLDANKDILNNTNGFILTLGNMEGGKFTPLSRFKFRLREGKNVYLFRISCDYYWSLGKMNALVLDPGLANSATSVRILEGD